jgi:hypothetical protein
MRLYKFDQELQTRIAKKGFFYFPGSFGPIERSEMLTGEEICDAGCREGPLQKTLQRFSYASVYAKGQSIPPNRITAHV